LSQFNQKKRLKGANPKLLSMNNQKHKVNQYNKPSRLRIQVSLQTQFLRNHKTLKKSTLQMIQVLKFFKSSLTS